MFSIFAMIIAALSEKMQLSEARKIADDPKNTEISKTLLKSMCWDRIIINGKWYSYVDAIDYLSTRSNEIVSINSQKLSVEEATKYVKQEYCRKLRK